MENAGKIDRWLFWPLLVSLGGVTILRLVCELPGIVSFVLIPLSFLLYAVTTVVVFAVSVIYAAKKRPRKAISVALAVVIPALLWLPIIWVAECVHLGLTVGVEQLGHSKPDESGFAAYDWSVGFAGQNTFLIYDRTDQIALPMAQHKNPSDDEEGWGEECAGKVRHLLGHYYICNF